MQILIIIAAIAIISFIWQHVVDDEYICPRCHSLTEEAEDFWGVPIVKCTSCGAELYL